MIKLSQSSGPLFEALKIFQTGLQFFSDCNNCHPTVHDNFIFALWGRVGKRNQVERAARLLQQVNTLTGTRFIAKVSE